MHYSISHNKIRVIFISILVWIVLILAAPVLQVTSNPFLRKISDYLYLFFKPTCHQLSSRSFHLAGHALAVCVRCLAFYLAGLTISFYYLFHHHPAMLRLRIYVLLCAPLLIDFILEKLNFYSNLYYLRFVTGFMTGLALFHLIIIAVSEKVTANETEK